MALHNLFQTHRIEALAFSAVLGLGPVLAGCATSGPANPYGLGPAQLGQVNTICRSTLGATSDDPRLGVCVYSLSARLDERNQAAKLVQADATCRNQGFQEGSKRALCVLDKDSTPPAQEMARPLQQVSDAEVLRRQQRACAAIGLNPATDAAFADCVQQMQDGFYKLTEPVAN